MQKDEIEEEALGHLRSASGKARLLATKKLKQFEGKCITIIKIDLIFVEIVDWYFRIMYGQFKSSKT